MTVIHIATNQAYIWRDIPIGIHKCMSLRRRMTTLSVLGCPHKYCLALLAVMSHVCPHGDRKRSMTNRTPFPTIHSRPLGNVLNPSPNPRATVADFLPGHLFRPSISERRGARSAVTHCRLSHFIEQMGSSSDLSRARRAFWRRRDRHSLSVSRGICAATELRRLRRF